LLSAAGGSDGGCFFFGGFERITFYESSESSGDAVEVYRRYAFGRRPIGYGGISALEFVVRHLIHLRSILDYLLCLSNSPSMVAFNMSITEGQGFVN
jgi:hypothetical protein